VTTTTFAILTALDAVARGETTTLAVPGDVYPWDRVAGPATPDHERPAAMAEITEPGRLRIQPPDASREERLAWLGKILDRLLAQAVDAHDVERATEP
jgi:hypothetical protein